jgi:hypothetical protein
MNTVFTSPTQGILIEFPDGNSEKFQPCINLAADPAAMVEETELKEYPDGLTLCPTSRKELPEGTRVCIFKGDAAYADEVFYIGQHGAFIRSDMEKATDARIWGYVVYSPDSVVFAQVSFQCGDWTSPKLLIAADEQGTSEQCFQRAATIACRWHTIAAAIISVEADHKNRDAMMRSLVGGVPFLDSIERYGVYAGYREWTERDWAKRAKPSKAAKKGAMDKALEQATGHSFPDITRKLDVVATEECKVTLPILQGTASRI